MSFLAHPARGALRIVNISWNNVVICTHLALFLMIKYALCGEMWYYDTTWPRWFRLVGCHLIEDIIVKCQWVLTSHSYTSLVAITRLDITRTFLNEIFSPLTILPPGNWWLIICQCGFINPVLMLMWTTIELLSRFGLSTVCKLF